MSTSATELQIDGLVGPSHNFSGLSFGNVASTTSAGTTSNPKAAALEGLDKMLAVAALGVPQAFLPPHPRPAIGFLRQCTGYTGDWAGLLERAHRLSPALLAAAWSSSAMWTANAATVFPSTDTQDGRAHLVVANLQTQLHRSIESRHTAWLLRALLPDGERFVVHDALPQHATLGDEGAANQMRFAPSHGQAGLHVLVYGSDGASDGPRQFPARQTRMASQAVAETGVVSARRLVLARQSPTAIDGGAFHNDVVAVANEGVLLAHERAFAQDVTAEVNNWGQATGFAIRPLIATEAELPLAEAVKTYLFNSQLLSVSAETGGRAGGMVLVAPAECLESARVQAVLARWRAESDGVLTDVRYVSVRQSMKNGGGPACLRLRLPVNREEMAAVNARLLLTAESAGALRGLISRHYPEAIAPGQLRDASLAKACLDAGEAVYQALGLSFPDPETVGRV